VAVVALQFLPRNMRLVNEGNRSLFPAFKFRILLSEGRSQGHKTYHADADDQNPPEFTHHVPNPPFVNDPLIHFSLGPIHYRHVQTSISKQFYFQGKNSSSKKRKMISAIISLTHKAAHRIFPAPCKTILRGSDGTGIAKMAYGQAGCTCHKKFEEELFCGILC
jgi:hypothetical protein